MSEERVWNDQTRDRIRQTLRSTILGEVRLAKRDHKEILQNCFEVYIMDDCPESEQSQFNQFAADELNHAVTGLSAEMATWPAETDCDHLDRVEATLRDQGILLWQASPCCDSCTGGELPDRIDNLDDRNPGFRDRVRGYAFFIDQNLPESLADSTALSVCLGYGWFSPEDSQPTAEAYKKEALGIAHEVCECLRNEGFEVNWDNDFARKICLSLNWQRRTLLS